MVSDTDIDESVFSMGEQKLQVGIRNGRYPVYGMVHKIWNTFCHYAAAYITCATLSQRYFVLGQMLLSVTRTHLVLDYIRISALGVV